MNFASKQGFGDEVQCLSFLGCSVHVFDTICVYLSLFVNYIIANLDVFWPIFARGLYVGLGLGDEV